MNKVRITGFIASDEGITLYTDEGKEVNLPKEGWRTKAIMDKITSPVARKKTVEIDLDEYSLEARIETKTGGVISFIRRKVKDFKNFFNIGQDREIDSDGNAEDLGPYVHPETETLVAVVKTEAGTVEIPGMEKIEKQIEHAAFNSAKGLQKFLERCATVKRGHTVRELLNFMEKGDLPIADDGSIVAYKVLRNSGIIDGKRITVAGTFFDPHSQKVPQKVGSFVTMDEKLVDPSRRTQCSTGLHIARRGYLRSFSADVATMVKVNPEDVIAVPEREPDKMRACGYHVVALLDNAAYQLLRNDQPATKHAPTAEILAKVIAGDHIGITERVIIGAAMGGDIKVEPTDLGKKLGFAKIVKDDTSVPKPAPAPIAPVKALDDKENKPAEVVSVKEVKKEIEAAVAEKAAEKAAKKTKRAEKPVATPKAAPAAKAVSTEVPEQYREAVKAVQNGMSQREAERKFGVSAKTIRRYTK